MFEIIDRGVPGMQLHRTHLNQSQQPRNGIHPKSSSRAAFALFNDQLMHALWYGWQGTLVIEGDSAFVSDEFQRPSSEVGEGGRSDGFPVADELFTARHNGIRKQLQDVGLRNGRA